MAEEIDAVVEEPKVETPEEPKEEPKETKPEETLEQKEARLARQLTQVRKKLGKDEEPKPTEVAKSTVQKTGELDETQLDLLDLKGITEEDDIDLIQKVMKNTGQTLRQVLKDEYVTAKLAINRKEREVKNATPSATKRSSSQTDDVEYWVNKAEQGGELPKDFDLKTKVIQRIASKGDTSVPPWRRK